MKRWLWWLPFALLLFACGSAREEVAERCPSPPAGFSEKELVGTWTDVSGDEADTLILRDDGTYRQTIHLVAPAFEYESEWLPWRVDYAANGLPYLHLIGMRLCAYGGGARVPCDQVGGGTGTAGDWYDPCEGKWIQIPGEGVLIVVGAPEGTKAPRGVRLFLLQKGEDTWGYQLKEP